MISPLLIAILITLTLIYLITRYRAFRAHVDRIPGPPVTRSLLLGNLDLFSPQASGESKKSLTKQDFVKKFFASIADLFEQYRSEGVFRLWLGPLNAVYVLTNAAAVENLLSSHVNVNKGTEYRFISPLLGNGLLMSEAGVWRHRRKLLVTGFHVKILQDFLPIFNTHTEKLLNKVAAQSSLENNNNPSSHSEKGVVIKDVRTLYEDLTLDIVKETSFGVDATADASVNESYRNALKAVFFGVSDRIRTPLHWLDAIYRLTERGQKFQEAIDYIRNYAERVIQRRRKRLFEESGEDFTAKSDDKSSSLEFNNSDSGIEEDGNTSSGSSGQHQHLNGRIIIDILLKAAEAAKHSHKPSPLLLTEHAIKAEVNTFILGGHDTTAEALTFSTLLLAAHPEIQAKVVAELKEVIGTAEEDEEEEECESEEDSLKEDRFHSKITFDHLRRLRYLEQTVKEAMRLWPSIQIIGRKLDEPLHLPDGKIIEAGSTCYVAPAFLHQDPEIFPEPTRFNPDRFGPGAKLPSNYAYVPFSAGPRGCIGQRYALLEIKFVLARLLLKYELKTVTRPEEVLRGIAVILKPLCPISVAFVERRRRRKSEMVA